jgi:hypothetical protein
MDALSKGKEAKDAGDTAKAAALYDKGYGLLNKLYRKYGLMEQAQAEKKAYQEKRWPKKKPTGLGYLRDEDEGPKSAAPAAPKQKQPSGLSYLRD